MLMERRLNSHSTTPEDMNTPVVQGHSAHHQQYRAPTFAGNLIRTLILGLISCSGGNFDNLADKLFIGTFFLALFQPLK